MTREYFMLFTNHLSSLGRCSRHIRYRYLVLVTIPQTDYLLHYSRTPNPRDSLYLPVESVLLELPRQLYLPSAST